MPANSNTLPNGLQITSKTDRIVSMAFGDMDGDGDMDLFLGRGHMVANAYVRNDGLDADGRPLLYVVNHEDTILADTTRIKAAGGTILAATGDYSHTYAATWVDMDADGDLDLIGGAKYGYKPELYRNDGRGSGEVAFASIADAAFLAASETGGVQAIAAGDVDGNGLVDLLLGASCGGQTAACPNQKWLNQDGGAMAAGPTPIPSALQHVAYSDIDGDGDLDFVGIDGSGDPVVLHVWRNEGGAQFVRLTYNSTHPSYPFGGYMAVEMPLGCFNCETGCPCNGQLTHFAWADVDGDGDEDLAVAVGGYNGQLLVYNEDGTKGRDAYDADTNSYTPRTGAQRLHANQLWLNDGGRFTYAGASNGLTSPKAASTHVAWGDLDGDGWPDLVVANLEVANHVFLNNGAGNLTSVDGGELTQPGERPETTIQLALGDLDGDGDIDVITLNHYFNTLRAAASTTFNFEDHIGDALSSPRVPIAVYANDGSATFTSVRAGTLGVPLVYTHEACPSEWGNAYGCVDGVCLNGAENNHRDFSCPSPEDRGDGTWHAGFNTRIVAIGLADFDGDGWLDVVAATEGTKQNQYRGVQLHLNRGVKGQIAFAAIAGTWAKVTRSIDDDVYSRHQWIGPFGGAFSPIGALIEADVGYMLPGDIDGDGDVDLYVGGSQTAGRLWRNDGAATFTDLMTDATRQVPATYGGALADVDGDGDLDLTLCGQQAINIFIYMHCQGATAARIGPAPAQGCVECTANSARAAATDVCFECGVHEQRASSGMCEQCSPGFARSIGGTRCTGCAVGSNQPLPGSDCKGE